jgi:hypothetical protein
MRMQGLMGHGLAIAVLAVLATAAGAAQPTPPRNANGGAKAKLYYDTYEPVQRLRLRRETCGRTEQAVGAFCVKACQRGYVAVAGKPVRCRSLTPLPPDHFPGPVRKEMDVLTRPVPKPGPSQNPKHGV